MIEILKGDITRVECSAIVNAANKRLVPGGGVDGAIHRAGGPSIAMACKKIGGCQVGEAVVTLAGQLPCDYIIHTVGPIWRGGDAGEEELLASCYHAILNKAEEYQLEHIAIPNISTGIYGFPKERACDIAVDVIEANLSKCKFLKRVTFICFNDDNYHLYRSKLSM